MKEKIKFNILRSYSWCGVVDDAINECEVENHHHS
jgi:hypothetical protein